MSRTRKHYLERVLFVLPALLFIAVFVAVPFFLSVFYSLTNWDGIGNNYQFIGFENYANLARDTDFIAAIKATLFYTFMGLLIFNPCALFVALILNGRIKGKNALRAMFYVPVTVSSVVVSNIWLLILHYDGYLNTVLRVLFNAGPIAWVNSYDVTRWVVLGVILWQAIGSNMVFYLAGLQSVPEELYEAAIIDGANARQKFFRVTLPMLMPTVTVVTFLQLASLVKTFDVPRLLTNGGPGNLTGTIAMLIFNQAFKFMTSSYATATGVVLLIMVSIISFIQLRVTRSRETEL